MRRAFLLICLALSLLIGPIAGDATAQTPQRAASSREITREFTIYDGDLASRVENAWTIARIRTLLRNDPSSPELMSRLIERHRVADMFVALQSLQTASPERVIDVLDVLQRSLIHFQLSDARRDGDRLRALLEPIAARVDAFPRETAARVVLALWALENETGRPLRNSVSGRWPEYADTAFARSRATFDAVDRIGDHRARLAELDRLVRERPGTADAAAALISKASFLAHNGQLLNRNETDPTDRILEILAIVKELESGRYPASAVETAPRIVVDLLAAPDQYVSTANAGRLLAAYREFLRSHASLRDGDELYRSGLFSLITQKIAPLLDPADPNRAIEILLHEELEPHGVDPDDIQLCLGQFYLRGARERAAADRTTLHAKGVAILERLSDAHRGLASRKALATIASKAFVDHDAARATALLARYLRDYPDSPWAWVAAMKLATLNGMEGNTARAAKAYLDVSRRYVGQPIARVVGAYLAGWDFEATGDETRAHTAYADALMAWDRDYGRMYDFPVTLPDDIERAWPLIDLDELTDRVARLSNELRQRDGATVAHAHWLVEQKRYVDASTVLQAFLHAHGSSPLAADARVLMHQAQLRTAMNAGNIWRKEHDDTLCMATLEALEREPYDFYVGMAFLAHASLLHRQGNAEEAARQAESAMQRLWAWRSAEIAKSPPDGLDADVAAIRSEMFRPGGVVPTIEPSSFGDLAFAGPTSPFVEVGAEVTVTSNGTTTNRTIFQSYAHAPMALPITDEEERLLTYVALIEDTTPSHAPIADLNPRDRVSWRSLLLGAAPAVTSVEFADAARTRASVQFSWRRSGYTATLEKIDGHWHVVRLLNIISTL